MTHKTHWIVASAFALLSPLAQAHEITATTSLLAGLAHPIAGLDHLAALLMAGVLIGRSGRATTKKLGLLIAALGLGALGGLLVGAQFGVESIIALSLPVLLVLLCVRRIGGSIAAIAMTSVLLVAHGWVHGIEAGALAYAFIAGFLLTSAAVMGLSVLLAKKWASARLNHRTQRDQAQLSA